MSAPPITVPMFRPVVAVEAAKQAVGEVLVSQYTGEGPRCATLESALATTLGYPRLLLTNSGTSALRLAYVLAGARAGAEVISTPQTCQATNLAILETGATIVWADVDPLTGNIDPEDAASKVTSRTVAIVGVDWAGRPCAFDRMRDLVRGVMLIEDGAHAFMAKGPRGDLVMHSYQSIKHLGMGDGGSLTCPSPAMHERAKLLRWFGLDRTRGDSMRCMQRVAEAGFKMQSNDILAAVGFANLPLAVAAVSRCREVARVYTDAIKSMKHVSSEPFDEGCSYWMFPLKVSEPIAFERFMRSRGIEVGQVHARNDVQPCFSSARHALELPGVDAFCSRQSNLPTMPHVSDRCVALVCDALREWDSMPEAKT